MDKERFNHPAGSGRNPAEQPQPGPVLRTMSAGEINEELDDFMAAEEWASPEAIIELKRHALELLKYGRTSISYTDPLRTRAGSMVFATEQSYENGEVSHTSSVSFFDPSYTREFESDEGLIAEITFDFDEEEWSCPLDTQAAKWCYEICKQTLINHLRPHQPILLSPSQIEIIKMFGQLCEARLNGDEASHTVIIAENSVTDLYDMVKTIAMENAPGIERQIYETPVDYNWTIVITRAEVIPGLMTEDEEEQELEILDIPALTDAIIVHVPDGNKELIEDIPDPLLKISLYGNAKGSPDYHFIQERDGSQSSFEDDGEPVEEEDDADLDPGLDGEVDYPVYQEHIDILFNATTHLFETAADLEPASETEKLKKAGAAICELAPNPGLMRNLRALLTMCEIECYDEDWHDDEQELLRGFPSARTAMRLASLYEVMFGVKASLEYEELVKDSGYKASAYSAGAVRSWLRNDETPGALLGPDELWFNEPIDVCPQVGIHERAIRLPANTAFTYGMIKMGTCRTRDKNDKIFTYKGPVLYGVVTMPAVPANGLPARREVVALPLRNALNPIVARTGQFN